MFNLIVKFDNGGVIDVESLRNDVKVDPRFYDKSKGVFTKSGKERLAAIEEIHSVQEQGLRYNVDDTKSTFKITDKNGVTVNPTEGRGVEVGKSISPFYGLINKEKRSKKEVSSILSNVKFKKDETKISDELAKREASKKEVAKVTPVKSASEEVINEEKEVARPEKSTASKAAETTSTSSTPAASIKTDIQKREEFKSSINNNVSDPNSILAELDKFNPESAIDKQHHDMLKGMVSNYKIQNNNNLAPEDFNEMTSGAESLRKMKEALKTGKPALKNVEALKKDIANQADIISKSTMSAEEKNAKIAALNVKLNKTLQVMDKNQNLESTNRQYKQLSKPLIDKYKAMMRSSFGDAITKQKEEEAKLQTEYYSPAIKTTYAPQFQNSINKLEKMRDQYENMSEEEIIDSIINSFGRKITTFQTGGSINYKDTEFESMSQNGENPFLKDLSVIISKGSKQGYPLENVRQTVNYKDTEYVTEENPNNVVNTQTGFKGTDQIINPTKSKFYKQEGAGNDKKGIDGKALKERLGNTFSSNQINTPVGNVQYNDILQFILLYKAHKKPVATVKPLSTIYREHGSRNVQAARDIDASSIQAAKNVISSLNSEYKGSDPIMAILAKNAVQGKKVELTKDPITQRADYRRSEEDLVNREMEERRLQGVDDLQKITANENFNR